MTIQLFDCIGLGYCNNSTVKDKCKQLDVCISRRINFKCYLINRVIDFSLIKIFVELERCSCCNRLRYTGASLYLTRVHLIAQAMKTRLRMATSLNGELHDTFTCECNVRVLTIHPEYVRAGASA